MREREWVKGPVPDWWGRRRVGNADGGDNAATWENEAHARTAGPRRWCWPRMGMDAWWELLRRGYGDHAVVDAELPD